MEASFFSMLRHVSRFYREFSKHKAREYRKEELDPRAKLGYPLQPFMMTFMTQISKGKSQNSKNALEGVETRKSRGVPIMSRLIKIKLVISVWPSSLS